MKCGGVLLVSVLFVAACGLSVVAARDEGGASIADALDATGSPDALMPSADAVADSMDAQGNDGAAGDASNGDGSTDARGCYAAICTDKNACCFTPGAATASCRKCTANDFTLECQGPSDCQNGSVCCFDGTTAKASCKPTCDSGSAATPLCEPSNTTPCAGQPCTQVTCGTDKPAPFYACQQRGVLLSVNGCTFGN